MDSIPGLLADVGAVVIALGALLGWFLERQARFHPYSSTEPDAPPPGTDLAEVRRWHRAKERWHREQANSITQQMRASAED